MAVHVQVEIYMLIKLLAPVVQKVDSGYPPFEQPGPLRYFNVTNILSGVYLLFGIS